MQRVLIYGEDRIPYRVEFETGRAGKIAIDVGPTGAVLVTAPEGETADAIGQAVARRARWIVAHIEEAYRRFEHVRKRDYVSGETVLYRKRHGSPTWPFGFPVCMDDLIPGFLKVGVRRWGQIGLN
jgi:hypothetical protein